MDKVQKIINDHDEESQDSVDDFSKRVQRITRKVAAALLLWLLSRLKVEKNKVLSTAGNLAVFAELPDKIKELLLSSGLDSAIDDFEETLTVQQEWVAYILKASGYTEKIPLDEAFLDAYRESKRNDLLTEAVFIAERAAIRGELSVGGLVDELTDTVGEEIATLPSQLRTAAATAIMMYYRTVAEQNYAAIEKQEELRFKYAGPPSGDPKIRPFCQGLMSQVEGGRSWTRPEIDNMDNGQLPNVFVTCGGYNCRHQFVVLPKA